jgi:hypothetical protein
MTIVSLFRIGSYQPGGRAVILTRAVGNFVDGKEIADRVILFASPAQCGANTAAGIDGHLRQLSHGRT